MTFSQLRTFLEVARQGSVRGAAATLLITEPSVSAALAALRDEMQVPLVEREGRGIRLTAAGNELARHAAQILGLSDQAVRRVREAAGQAAPLKLVAVTTASEYVLPPILKVYRQAHPGVQLRMEVGNRASVIDRLSAREADLGFGGRPPEGRGLVGTPFLNNELIVVGPGDHPLAGEPAFEPARLSRETWLVREPGSGTRETTEEFWAQSQFQVSSLMTLGSNGAVKQSAAAGLGITLISRHAVAAQLASGSLRALPVEGTPLRRSWYVLYPEDNPLSGSASQFLDLVQSPGVKTAVDDWFGAAAIARP
ncbi:MAG TPA: LysR substrate-binding domain-containing protein [Actinomycetota bacterium]|nr:LysR substrate-binding domain-containing protein [Actinomycetota bacterium]